MILFSLFSNIAFGESYCKDYFNDIAGEIPHYGDFWNIEDDGSFKLDKVARSEYPTASLEDGDTNDKTKPIFIGVNPEFGLKRHVKIIFDDKKRISKMEIMFGGIEQPYQQDDKRVITLGYKGDKCYPLSHETFNDRGKAVTDFQINACKEVDNYFDKNKEALECKCGTDKTNKALQKILDDNHILTATRLEMDDKRIPSAMDYIDGYNSSGMLIDSKVALSRSLWHSIMLRENCRKTIGVEAALADKDLWEVKSTADEKDKQPHAIKQN